MLLEQARPPRSSNDLTRGSVHFRPASLRLPSRPAPDSYPGSRHPFAGRQAESWPRPLSPIDWTRHVIDITLGNTKMHAIQPQNDDSGGIRRSAWLATLVGWLVQLGLVELLPTLFSTAARLIAAAGGLPLEPFEPTANASSIGWRLEQTAIFLASLLAGGLAGYLSVRESWSVPIGLIFLSLAASLFRQLPSPRTEGLIAVWALLPCLGLVGGVVLVWALRRRVA